MSAALYYCFIVAFSTANYFLVYYSLFKATNILLYKHKVRKLIKTYLGFVEGLGVEGPFINTWHF